LDAEKPVPRDYGVAKKRAARAEKLAAVKVRWQKLVGDSADR
jgi:hypothetical protein